MPKDIQLCLLLGKVGWTSIAAEKNSIQSKILIKGSWKSEDASDFNLAMLTKVISSGTSRRLSEWLLSAILPESKHELLVQTDPNLSGWSSLVTRAGPLTAVFSSFQLKSIVSKPESSETGEHQAVHCIFVPLSVTVKFYSWYPELSER